MSEVPTRRSEPVPTWESPVQREPGALFPWWTVVVLGLVSVLFGIVVLVWPNATLRVMAVLVGIWLLVAGILRIAGAFLPGAGLGRQVLSGIVGVVLVLGGLACLRNLVTALAVLAFMVALTWIFSGLAEVVVAVQATGATRAALLVLGVLSLLAGFVFLVTPRLSLAALIVLTGVSALVIGVGELALAVQLRKVRA
jgi:uncharacterized membrane protein HdeD (DUF308 family)